MNLQDPVLATYAVAAALMILKMMAQGWITVVRMMKVQGGFVNPEDARAGVINPEPRPGQTDPDEYVERSRRMHRNELENVPGFLVAGLLFALTQPPLWLAQALFYGFVVARIGHFWTYITAKGHEPRAFFYTVGSLIVMGMSGYTLVHVIS